MLTMQKKRMVSGLKFEPNDILPECNTCTIVKLTNLLFPKDGKRTSCPLEIVHTVLCGPLRNCVPCELNCREVIVIFSHSRTITAAGRKFTFSKTSQRLVQSSWSTKVMSRLKPEKESKRFSQTMKRNSNNILEGSTGAFYIKVMCFVGFLRVQIYSWNANVS